jgi:hypothetical protein
MGDWIKHDGGACPVDGWTDTVGRLMCEQLRKASDGPDMGTGHDVRCGLLNRVHDHALNHRLGIAQPEGEPCEPRPAGARWRAMV